MEMDPKAREVMMASASMGLGLMSQEDYMKFMNDFMAGNGMNMPGMGGDMNGGFEMPNFEEAEGIIIQASVEYG